MRQRNKKRSIKWFLSFLLCGLFIVGIWGGYAVSKDEQSDEKDGSLLVEARQELNSQEVGSPVEDSVLKDITFFDDVSDVEAKVDALVEQMTIEEKVGQLMVVGFQENQVNDHIRAMIQDYHVGGVIYFDRNMVNPTQVATLTNQLQKLSMEKDLEIPLSISIDQEGGAIVRMRDQFPNTPSQQSLGLQDDEKFVYHTASITAKELVKMGINSNYAPVLDLSSTDSRSFGTNPEKVALYGAQVVQAFNDQGISASLKHFPGNGRSNVDPHYETSSVKAGKEELEKGDIYPFTKIMKEFNHNQLSVMVTHIKYPAYDAENPASISNKIVTDLLRNQLGFQGIIITDDLEMGAVSKYVAYVDVGVKALQAGVDILLVCHTKEHQVEVYNGIIKAVNNTLLTEERINESVKRVLLAKLQNAEILKLKQS